MAYFLSYYRIWQTIGNKLSDNTRYFDRYCASYVITLLGPKKSRTNFFKIKAIVPEKKISANFFSCCPLWQTWSNILLCSTRYFGIYGVSYKIISLTPRSLLKTQVFEKKEPFQWRKDSSLFFPALSTVTNLRGQFLTVHKVFWQLLREVKDLFFNTHESVENTKFWKKIANFPVRKVFWPGFCRIIEHDKRQGTTYEGPQGILKITVEVTRSFL